MIDFECAKCGWQLELSDKYAGKRIRCKNCKQIGVVAGLPATVPAGFTSRGDDTPQEFMEQNYHVFQELLRHEREAPAFEGAVLR